jgi:hypothetical protein
MAWAKPRAGARPNFGHPHARGLRHCFLFNEGSGRMVTDCVGGLQATFNNGTPLWSARLHGGSIAFDGASDLALVAGRSVFNTSTGPFTIIVGLMQTGSQAGFQTIWANGGNGLYLQGGAVVFFSTTTSQQTLTTQTPYVLSTSARYDNAGVTNQAGEIEYCINGRPDCTNNFVTFPALTGASIGGHGAEFFIGEISFIYIYDRFISAGFVREGGFQNPGVGNSVGIGGPMSDIHANPFAMFYEGYRRQVWSQGFITPGGNIGIGWLPAYPDKRPPLAIQRSRSSLVQPIQVTPVVAQVLQIPAESLEQSSSVVPQVLQAPVETLEQESAGLVSAQVFQIPVEVLYPFRCTPALPVTLPPACPVSLEPGPNDQPCADDVPSEDFI